MFLLQFVSINLLLRLGFMCSSNFRMGGVKYGAFCLRVKVLGIFGCQGSVGWDWIY